eukprot:310996_1
MTSSISFIRNSIHSFSYISPSSLTRFVTISSSQHSTSSSIRTLSPSMTKALTLMIRIKSNKVFDALIIFCVDNFVCNVESDIEADSGGGGSVMDCICPPPSLGSEPFFPLAPPPPPPSPTSSLLSSSNATSEEAARSNNKYCGESIQRRFEVC